MPLVTAQTCQTGGDGFTLTRADRLTRGSTPKVDAQLEAVLANKIDWSVSAANSGYVRHHERYRDAKIATRALGTAGAILGLRAAVVPPVIRFVAPENDAGFQAMVAGLLDPAAALAAAICAAIVLACALLVARKPLLATATALLSFVALTCPFVIAEAKLFSPDMILRLVIAVLLVRATSAGLAHRMR